MKDGSDLMPDPYTGRYQFWHLVGQTPVPCSLEEWAVAFAAEDRHVLLTKIGPFRVSTVFLGVDHNFSDAGPPLLFETLTFVNAPTLESSDFEGNNDCDGRWATWVEAETAHRRAVAFLRTNYCHAGEQPMEIVTGVNHRPKPV